MMNLLSRAYYIIVSIIVCIIFLDAVHRHTDVDGHNQYEDILGYYCDRDIIIAPLKAAYGDSINIDKDMVLVFVSSECSYCTGNMRTWKSIIEQLSNDSPIVVFISYDSILQYSEYYKSYKGVFTSLNSTPYLVVWT